MAQPVIDWSTLGGGGAVASGGVYELSGTVGQMATGPSAGGAYTLDDGFWSVPAADLSSRELIVNGGFEDVAGTFVPDGYGLMSLLPGSTVIPGWTTVDAELAWCGNANTFGARTPFGDGFLELTGYHDHLPYGGVEQTITTTPGQRYRLSLSLGSNAEYPGAGGRKEVSVRCGEVTTSVAFDPAGTPANEWSTFGFTFVAASTTTPIRITGLNASGIYLAVDQVSVVPDVAELRIVAVGRSGNELRVRFAATAGEAYVLESRSAWTLDPWQVVPGTETTGVDGTGEIVLADPFAAPQRFYRVRANAAGGR